MSDSHDEIVRLRAELAAARQALERATFLLDIVPFYLVYVDADWNYRLDNRQVSDWIDPAVPRVGKPLSDVIGQNAFDDLREYLESAMGGDHIAYDRRIRFGHHRRHVHAEYVPHEVDGEVLGFGAMIENMTARRRNEERLRQAAVVFEASRDAIMIFDAKHRVTRVNQAFTKLTGYTPEHAGGERARDFIVPLRGWSLDVVWDAMLRDGQWSGELYFRDSKGSVRHVWVSVSCVSDETGFIHNYVAVLTSMETHTTLSHLAHHDALTGLPNRLLLDARLQHTLERAQRHTKPAAVFYMDLDRFKPINDSHGHAVGDAVLIEVAHRLTRVVRAQDTVARLGGDEFVVLLDDYQSLDDVAHVASRILETIAEPIGLDGLQHEVGISIGISRYPEDGEDAEALLEAADRAMYLAKSSGRGNAFVSGAQTPLVHRRQT